MHKQYRSGFMLNAEYQYTRVLGTENFQNPLTVGDSYGNIGGITPQVLEVSYSYLLPFGNGQLLFSDAGNLVNKVISGWQLSGITACQSGQPFSVTYTSSLQGSVRGRANRVPGVPLYPRLRAFSSGSIRQRLPPRQLIPTGPPATTCYGDHAIRIGI